MGSCTYCGTQVGSEPCDYCGAPIPPEESACPMGRMRAKVSAVHSGDTIDIEVGSATFRVTLYGIDCPIPGESFYDEASFFTAHMVHNKIVEAEILGCDNSGGMIGIVYTGVVNVNEELLINPPVEPLEHFTEPQAPIPNGGKTQSENLSDPFLAMISPLTIGKVTLLFMLFPIVLILVAWHYAYKLMQRPGWYNETWIVCYQILVCFPLGFFALSRNTVITGRQKTGIVISFILLVIIGSLMG
ncbi:thermonuclease family protein [Thermodesulfobacteriota bacterium]